MKWGWWHDVIEFKREPKPLIACCACYPFWRMYYPVFIWPIWWGIN
jgi:hypothetical protein